MVPQKGTNKDGLNSLPHSVRPRALAAQWSSAARSWATSRCVAFWPQVWWASCSKSPLKRNCSPSFQSTSNGGLPYITSWSIAQRKHELIITKENIQLTKTLKFFLTSDFSPLNRITTRFSVSGHIYPLAINSLPPPIWLDDFLTL